MSYFESIKFLLGKKVQLLLPMVLLFLMSSLVDLFGIGLIGGYVGIIIDPSLVKTIQEMFPAFEFLNNYDHEQTEFTEVDHIVFTGMGGYALLEICLHPYYQKQIFMSRW